MAEAPYRRCHGYLIFFLLMSINCVQSASFVKRSVDESKDVEESETRMPRNLLDRDIKSPVELETLKARLSEEPNLVPAMKRMARFLFDFASTDDGNYVTDGGKAGNLLSLGSLDVSAVQEGIFKPENIAIHVGQNAFNFITSSIGWGIAAAISGSQSSGRSLFPTSSYDSYSTPVSSSYGSPTAATIYTSSPSSSTFFSPSSSSSSSFFSNPLKLLSKAIMASPFFDSATEDDEIEDDDDPGLNVVYLVEEEPTSPSAYAKPKLAASSYPLASYKTAAPSSAAAAANYGYGYASRARATFDDEQEQILASLERNDDVASVEDAEVVSMQQMATGGGNGFQRAQQLLAEQQKMLHQEGLIRTLPMHPSGGVVKKRAGQALASSSDNPSPSVKKIRRRKILRKTPQQQK